MSHEGMMTINKLKLLKEIRDTNEPSKILFKTLVKKDSLVIATKVRGRKEETLIDIGAILEPYIGAEEIETLKDACNTIYNRTK